MTRITKEQLKEVLKKVFDEVDANKNGFLSHDELKTAIEKAGLKPTQDDITKLITACDKEGNGKISFEEFAKALIETYIKFKILLRLHHAFITIDTGNTGFITKEDLKKLIAEQDGDQITDEDADKLIATVDKDGDGKISFVEFVHAAAEFVEKKLKATEAK